MPRSYYDPNTLEFPFVEVLTTVKRRRKVKLPANPIWTKNKAKLIEKYCLRFALIAKHGTYIDGFAGPQRQNSPDMWAAKLVLESQPKWFRNFYLFDANRNQVARLEELRDSQPPPDRSKNEPKRTICVEHGDCNTLIINLLKEKKIKEREATFCLLDQRTFECEWATLEAISRYRPGSNKIEILYFLPNSWLDRALAAQLDKTVIERWWGRKDWLKLRSISPTDRALMFIDRFKKELGYSFVEAWPIFKTNAPNVVMYYMVHATDHPAAPKAMETAYAKAVAPDESVADVQIEIDEYLQTMVESQPRRRLHSV